MSVDLVIEIEKGREIASKVETALIWKILLPNVKKVEVCHHHKVEEVEVKVKKAREKVRAVVVDPEVEREIPNLAREAKAAEEAKIERDEVEAIPEVEASLGVSQTYVASETGESDESQLSSRVLIIYH